MSDYLECENCGCQSVEDTGSSCNSRIRSLTRERNEQATRIRELQAEKDEWKMMYEVIEEKLNEYIDKTKAAEVRLAEMHSAWSAGIQYDNWRANEEQDDEWFM